MLVAHHSRSALSLSLHGALHIDSMQEMAGTGMQSATRAWRRRSSSVSRTAAASSSVDMALRAASSRAVSAASSSAASFGSGRTCVRTRLGQHCAHL